MCPGFKSRESHDFFFLFIYFFFYVFFLSLLFQCKFANSTLLSLLRFSYFITPYDPQASSAFSALIIPLALLVQMLELLSFKSRIIMNKRNENFH